MSWNAPFCSGSRASSRALEGSPLKSEESLSISSRTMTGFDVPALHGANHWPFGESRYPPTANDWANPSVAIQGWVFLGGVYPEPGMVVAHPSTDGPGHCGIVDYDGWTISARKRGVCRKAMKMLDGTCSYRKPTEVQNEE